MTKRDRDRCQSCGTRLEVLRHPLRRLVGTGYWLRGFKSLFTSPLRTCPSCGGIYTTDGELIADGAVETATELRIRGLREDMTSMRDSFLTVFLAGEFAAVWMLVGGGTYNSLAPVICSIVGLAALPPAGYFGRKSRQFRQEMKRLREERTRQLIESSDT